MVTAVRLIWLEPSTAGFAVMVYFMDSGFLVCLAALTFLSKQTSLSREPWFWNGVGTGSGECQEMSWGACVF